MTRTADHSNLELQHVYRGKPELVFKAWSDPEALMRWGAPGEGWRTELQAFQFEVGGEQITEFGPAGGPVFVNRMRYYDIVPGIRIVMAGGLTRGAETLFAGVLTVEFTREGEEGCRLLLTEQGVFLDGQDLPENHRDGWLEMLRRLELELPAPSTINA
ncbi:SRPBCC domain-containing protein [Phenylobacterium sp.]|jgi:uncharacterized protein YndB with AHSA1/START domain|uniref:SRPBCC domain-containing protein n=1 Tax=Phenylobacterium sp. TaxID=1871053 RepID=UPI002E331923|nr:SRPBCC domain-containing protein [Phenylobacterium sp.]HEX4710609.1 SRPBCC domain-containing protein [Phenylobacterium sp.]